MRILPPDTLGKRQRKSAILIDNRFRLFRVYYPVSMPSAHIINAFVRALTLISAWKGCAPTNISMRNENMLLKLALLFLFADTDVE